MLSDIISNYSTTFLACNEVTSPIQTMWDDLRDSPYPDLHTITISVEGVVKLLSNLNPVGLTRSL